MERDNINVVVERARAAIGVLPAGPERTALECMMDLVERVAAGNFAVLAASLGKLAADSLWKPRGPGGGASGS